MIRAVSDCPEDQGDGNWICVTVAKSILYVRLVFSSVVQRYTLQSYIRDVRHGPAFWVLISSIPGHSRWIQPAPENFPDTDAADTDAADTNATYTNTADTNAG